MTFATQEYRQQTVTGASPLRRVVLAYDVAILACEQHNLPRATQAVSLLRDSLNLEAGEPAPGLLRLYQWCLDCIRGDRYPEALKVLRSLREAWRSVELRAAAAATLAVPVPAVEAGAALR